MSSSAASKNAILRDAFTATATKEKGPPAADGILSITPDAPDVAEWRRNALDVAETTSTYLDDDDDGPKPNELYGKFTWKIENFSEISKRELRSNVFDVGNYKWYILVYPQGCDVCNHLSLFLCVADYDKLLPGWSHFAQFTIAVVNKDPKKSKYSDTLHRFCKKEHDWGWKKFMELSKVLDGFTHNDTLIIKAQVQVIIDKPSRPFRCLDPQYRRELVRVYLTNVEGVCRRFCEDKKSKLGWVRDEIERFKDYWLGLSKEAQRKLLADKAEGILKGLVKQFFNEKEVTSTLVMDALFSGLKQVEEHSRSYSEGKGAGPDGPPLVLIKPERNTFSLHGDLLEVAERVSKDFIPAPKEEKPLIAPNDGLTLRSGQEDDYRRDSIEIDEKRLAELGRKTVEMFAIGYIISERMEVAYRDAEALKRQDQLIAEEFETQKLEESKAKAQAEKDKEKKAKKKEKVKAKKDAEKAKKNEEDAEKKKIEDAKRLEQERKAQEVAAEKKRQEDEATKARQQAAAKQASASKQAASSSVEQNKTKAATKASSGDKSSINSSLVAPSAHPFHSSLGSSLELGTDAFEDADSMSGGGAGGLGSEGDDADDGDVGASVELHSSVAGYKGAGVVSHELAGSGESSAPGSTQGGASRAVAHSHARSADDDEDDEGNDDPDDEEAAEMSERASATAPSHGRGSIGRISADDLPSSAEQGYVSALLSTNVRLEQDVMSLKSKVNSLERQLAERDAEVSTLQARLSEVQQSSTQSRVQSKQPFSAPYNPAAAGSATKASKESKEPSSQPPPPPPPASSQQNAAAARRPPGPFDASNATSASVAASAAVHGRASVPPPAVPPPPPQQQQQQQQQQIRSAALGSASFLAPPSSVHQLQNGRPRVNSETSAASVAVAAAAASAAVSGGGRPSLSNGSQPQTAAAAAQQFTANQQAAASIHQHPINPGSSNDGLGLGLPSYRNAAAGVALGSSGQGVSVNAPNPSHLQQQQQQGSQAQQTRTTTTSITPPATPKSNGGNEGGPAAGHLSHTATEFSANHRLVMQQQASFGQQQQQQQQANAKRAMQAPHPMHSPGLDDFAHMGLIDDLLTE